MRSALYQGIINHSRRSGPSHQFSYPIFMVYLDLDDIEAFFRLSPLWSMEAFNWASFKRKDYLHPETHDLKQAVIEEIKAQTGEDFKGSVYMLGHVRYLGLCFNPATFYFCFNDDELSYVVTEVTNTPWHDRHTYVLQGAELNARSTTKKAFHVSPFLGMDMEYQWKITPPSDTTTVSITNLQQGSPVFNATLRLERLTATSANLNRILFRFPAVTLKTIGGIYWQALRLWIKGARFHNHPQAAEDQTL